MKSKIFSSEFAKAASKDNVWITAFLMLGFLLAFPVISILMVGNWRGLAYTPSQLSLLYEYLWRDGFLMTGGAVTGAAAVINSARDFLYLYSRRQTDFYHSLPVKRSRMFWGRVYAGFCRFLLPYLAMGFLAICIGAAEGFFSLNLMVMALKLLGIHVLVYFILYFSMVLIPCITGNYLVGILCLAGMNLFGNALSDLLWLYSREFYHTFFYEKPYGVLEFLEQYVSPAFLAVNFMRAYRRRDLTVVFIIAVIALTAALALISCFAYRRRPSEAAGRPIVFRWVEKIVKFAIVISCGMGIGYIFYVLPGSRTRTSWWIFGLLLGTVVSHGLLEMLFQMDVGSFFSKKKELLAAVILVVICGVFFQRDLSGFDQYLPAQNHLSSFSLDFMSISNEYGCMVERKENGTFLINGLSGWENDGMELCSEQGVGDRTYQALQTIINNQDSRKSVKQQDSNSEEMFYSMGIRYKMKSGKKVYRSYLINPDECRELVSCIYDEENLKDIIFSFMDLRDEYLAELNLLCADGVSYSLFQNDKERQEELLQALAKDIRDVKGDEMVDIPCARLEVVCSIPVDETADQLIPGKKKMPENVYWSVNILPAYQRTLALLKQTEYPMSMEDLGIEKVSVTYYHTDSEETVVYEKPEEIEALKPAMVPYSLTSMWMDYYTKADACSYFDKKQINGTYVYLLKDQIPDFVKEASA